LTHSQFLWNQVNSLQKDSSDQRLFHKAWTEVAADFVSYDQQATSKIEQTAVTPYGAYSFVKTFLHWQEEHQLFDTVERCVEVKGYGKKRRREWNFPNELRSAQTASFRDADQETISRAEWLLEEAATDSRPVRISDPNELLRAVVVIRLLRSPKEWDQYGFRHA
jgi:hypothetical protein